MADPPAAPVVKEKSRGEVYGNVTVELRTRPGFSLLRAGVEEERERLMKNNENDDDGADGDSLLEF